MSNIKKWTEMPEAIQGNISIASKLDIKQISNKQKTVTGNCQYCHSGLYDSDRNCPSCGAPNAFPMKTIAAIDAVPTYGGVVFFPAGAYKITSTLIVAKDGVILQGAGDGGALDSDSKDDEE